MALPEPRYEMTLTKGLTLRLKGLVTDGLFLPLLDQMCQDIHDMHDDEWQVVTSCQLCIFMDKLLSRNWQLHVGDVDWTERPQTSEVHIDDVAYEYV